MVRAGTIGHPLRTVAAARTTCTSPVATSTQARATAKSTTVVWRVASLVINFDNRIEHIVNAEKVSPCFNICVIINQKEVNEK